MTLIIELDPDTDERLDRAAAAHGVKKEEYARQLLAASTIDSNALWLSRTPAERVEAFREWVESHHKYAGRPVPLAEALDRESIYEGR
jgi:predicted transcriptional regulator